MFDQTKFLLHRAKKRLLFPLRRRFGKYVNQLDDPRKEKALCQSCKSLVEFFAYHIGFSCITPLYCDHCADILVLDDNGSSYGTIVSVPTSNYGKNWEEAIRKVDSTLPKCKCGGSFAYMNPPRCPKCAGLMFGDFYEGKPILKVREGYTFASRHTYKIGDLK